MGNNKGFNAESAIQLWKASEDFSNNFRGASLEDFKTIFCHVSYNFLLGIYNNSKRNVDNEEWLYWLLVDYTNVLKESCEVARRMLMKYIKDRAAVAATVAALAEEPGQGETTEGVQRAEDSTASE